ncbi:hypothetical protein LTR84_009730 [Exophiala bonariae]|uniref:Exosome complex protein n=1 Tax=Exophiala bonariae TaxID=1690606 RepID=A0AAV9NKQ0_9EURO|nr:hypothetical protein LTR84_009730 [Exophiala bonariae]
MDAITSYLPAGAQQTLATLEATVTSYLRQIFDNLPSSVQTHLLNVAASPHLSRTNLQYILRLIVIISTYILFRPHLEALLRKATGAPDPRATELENRLRFLQDLKDGKIQPQGGVEVVDGKVVLKPRAPAGAGVMKTLEKSGASKKKGTGKGKVVKLVVPGDEDQGPQQQQQRGDKNVADASPKQSPVSTATPNTRASTRRRKA